MKSAPIKSGARPRPREKRAAPRVSTCKKTVIYPHVDGKAATAIDVDICDISTSGVGLIADEPLARGVSFELRMKLPEKAITRLYVVERCKSCGDRKMRIGARLLNVSDGHRGNSFQEWEVERIRQIILA